MKKAAVIGNPIAHSKSPLIHNYWLKEFNVEGSYEAIRVENNNEFKKTVMKLAEDGYSGFNVTIPFKGLAHQICDEHVDFDCVSHYPGELKAANTIKIKDGKLIGYNTDFFGFYRTIKAPMNTNNKSVIILGAGGAARSIAFGLANMKKYFWKPDSTLTILNRNEDRAKTLINDIYKSNITTKKMKDDLNLLSGPLEDIYERIKGCNYIINTTPMGMNKKNEELPFDISCFREANIVGDFNLLTVYDIIYNPLETTFLKEAEKMNLLTHNGLGMLIWQAAPAFGLFFLENKIDNFESQYAERFNKTYPELRAKLIRDIR